jgi:beta-galactosidase
LLDGPLFGAFGAYGMDGSRTSRSDMASRMAKWANEPENEKLWKAKPVKGDIGIVVIPEAHVFNFAQQGNTQFYREDLWGAYQGFFDNHIQADWVHIDHIAEYDLLYLPYSLMLTQESARKLSAWVAAGGRLVSEGCPAYFGDRARACTVQPGLGLDQVFGVKEKYVEFTPDILGELTFRFKDIPSIHGGIFLQEYEPVSGDIAGTYENGEAAVVENRYGNGKTLIIGTFPGAGYYRHHGNDSKRFFASILEWAGKQPQIKCSCDQVSARIQASEEGTFLWVVNHHREEKEVIIELSDTYRGSGAADILWGSPNVNVLGNKLTAVVGGRDALVLELKK